MTRENVMAINCASCGRGTIRTTPGAGRRMRYKQIPDLELPRELALPTCDSCGELWLGPQELSEIEGALSKAYDRELNRRADDAVNGLREVISQRDLERLIGVSAGLLSKIRAGKDTSPTLTALLMLLAAEPTRIEELKQLWRCVRDDRFGFQSRNTESKTVVVEQYARVSVGECRVAVAPPNKATFPWPRTMRAA